MLKLVPLSALYAHDAHAVVPRPVGNGKGKNQRPPCMIERAFCWSD
jgi:hypothetical protein